MNTYCYSWLMMMGVLTVTVTPSYPNAPQNIDELPGNPPSPYVARPTGWKGYAGVVTDEMRQKTAETIKNYPPLGTLIKGGDLPQNREWAVFVEWHWHPRGKGFAAEGWHRGATVIWRNKQ